MESLNKAVRTIFSARYLEKGRVELPLELERRLRQRVILSNEQDKKGNKERRLRPFVSFHLLTMP